jgi:hypothetical protein
MPPLFQKGIQGTLRLVLKKLNYSSQLFRLRTFLLTNDKISVILYLI